MAIDKSLRQHYQEGEKVKKFGSDAYEAGKKLFFPQDKTGLDEKQLLKNVAGSALKRAVTSKLTSKLAGTGILSSLGPIGMIIAMMLARKGIGKGQEYLTQKWGEGKGGALQAFQAGFGSPQEGRELRKLEKRRANMLQRKEEGRNYSEKNLDMVTRAIAEAKGLDINNPNEMRNIDKPITQIQIEKSITPKTVEKTAAMEDIITRPTVEKTAAMEDIITRPTVVDTAAMEDIITRPTVVDTAAMEDIITAPPKRTITPVHAPHQYRGGNGGGGGMGKGQDPGGGAAGSPFLKGGRVDKALSGRSRYL